jgi:hypothetical protein
VRGREETHRLSRVWLLIPCSHGRTVRRTVRAVVRVCVRVSVCPSLCPSDKFSDANPDPTSDGPPDGPDFCPTFCPTFSGRGYCNNNDHVSPLAGRRHGSKSAVANFRTAELHKHRTCCCCAVLVCWHCCSLILLKKNIVLWPNALVPLLRIKYAPHIEHGYDRLSKFFESVAMVNFPLARGMLIRRPCLHA